MALLASFTNQISNLYQKRSIYRTLDLPAKQCTAGEFPNYLVKAASMGTQIFTVAAGMFFLGGDKFSCKTGKVENTRFPTVGSTDKIEKPNKMDKRIGSRKIFV